MITLVYFPFPGRAGSIRDALNIGRITFVDRHVTADAFAAMKADGSLPWGALPVLEVEAGGRTLRISQSNAILRYVGRLADLYPETALEALLTDEAVDACDDLLSSMGQSIREADPERKMAIRAQMASEFLPRDLGRLERMLEARGGPWFGGPQFTVADLKVWHSVNKLTDGSLDGIPTTVADPFATLAEWRARAGAERQRRLES